jgi:nucleolar complex protein 2
MVLWSEENGGLLSRKGAAIFVRFAQRDFRTAPSIRVKMGRVKKSTRKFEKHHLKDTLERRKEFAKIKQRSQIRAKKKAKNAGDGRISAANSKYTTEETNANGEEGDLFGDMGVEEFFQEAFKIPESKGRKPNGTKDAVAKTGKRRRIEQDGKHDDRSSVNSLEDAVASTASGYQSSAGDDFETHKEDLNALAEKDPEFYSYLKENDAELLEFAENNEDNLTEVDALSDSEVEGTPKKKRRKLIKDTAPDGDESDETEVTAAIVKKWEIALTKNNSLRAMRQVVLAFRAAAHVNEDDGKDYKYTISDPDGICPSIGIPNAVAVTNDP